MIDRSYRVVLAHEDFWVIDKSPGIPVHQEGEQPGILHYVAADTGTSSWYLCHRLDRDTSGLLLLARTKAAAAELSQQFAERKVNKCYVAVTDRRPKKSQGLISGDMVKSRNGSWRLSQTASNPARTQFYSRSLRPGFRAILLKPLTGRTHQLRVAMAALGAPLLGDQRYRGTLADRLYLHAFALGFTYGGQTYQVQQPPDRGEAFQDFFQSPDDTWLAPLRLAWPRLQSL